MVVKTLKSADVIFFYYANDAQLDYKTILRECREGIDFSREDFKEICEVIKAGILKGHSFIMIPSLK
jgi:hypothetical protein